MERHSQSPRDVDYKTLFLGAAVLVSLLGGGLWNVWNSYHLSNEDEQRRTNDLQWERLRDLASVVTTNKSDIERLRHESDDQEVRLRSAEGQLSKYSNR